MLSVQHLTKKYPSFTLKDISFSLPKGYIMGFIGMNGAGKSTTLKSILNLVQRDGGKVFFMGKDFDQQELKCKQEIGFSLGQFDFYNKTKIQRIVSVYRKFYQRWDDQVYTKLITRFHIDENKKVCELSSGMQVKLGLALALSHHSKLIILDEPTSGLDPIARDELLDLFQGIVEDGEKSILFSTHITSDLDKCADFILLIRDGEIIANSTKDEMIASHCILEGTLDKLTESLRSRMIGFKTSKFGFSGLIRRADIAIGDPEQREVPNLEDIMIYYNKEKMDEKFDI